MVALRAHRGVGILSVLRSASQVLHAVPLQFGHLAPAVRLQCFQIVVNLANPRQKRVVHVCVGSAAGPTVDSGGLMPQGPLPDLLV